MLPGAVSVRRSLPEAFRVVEVTVGWPGTRRSLARVPADCFKGALPRVALRRRRHTHAHMSSAAISVIRQSAALGKHHTCVHTANIIKELTRRRGPLTCCFTCGPGGCCWGYPLGVLPDAGAAVQTYTLHSCISVGLLCICVSNLSQFAPLAVTGRCDRARVVEVTVGLGCTTWQYDRSLLYQNICVGSCGKSAAAC